MTIATLIQRITPKAPSGLAAFPACVCGSREYRAIKTAVAFTRGGYRFIRQVHVCVGCLTQHNFQRRTDGDWEHNIPAPRTYGTSGHRVRL